MFVALVYIVFNGALSYLAARLRTRLKRQVAPPAADAEQAADRELELPRG